MAIKAVIIDDEKDVRYLLRNILEQHFQHTIELLGEADDVMPGIQLIEEQKPELVFLDIKMKKGTGFDLLQQVKTVDFEVIFITAYDRYAIQAFKFAAFGYLLKPVKVAELKEEIARLQQHMLQQREGNDKRVKVLVDNYGDKSGQMKRLCISHMDGFDVLDVEDILRLESENNYTHFITCQGKKVTTSRTIKEYEDLLAEHGFYRVHQRHIINLRHVKSYVKGDGGAAILRDNTEIPVARNRKAGFVRRFI